MFCHDLFSVFMDAANARFMHQADTHWNGKCYGGKPSIPRNAKCWKFRNNLWSVRYIMAIFKIQILLNIFQSGSNINEHIHGCLNRWYGWLKLHGGGLSSAVAYGHVGLFKNNITRAEKLMKMSAENKEQHKIVWSDQFINKYYKVLCAAEELCEIDPNEPMLPQQNEHGHGIFFFEDAVKSFEDHLERMYIYNIATILIQY